MKTDGFGKYFLLHEFADVKNMYSKETIGVECTGLVKRLTDPVTQLESCMKEAQAVMRTRIELAKKKPRGSLVKHGYC